MKEAGAGEGVGAARMAAEAVTEKMVATATAPGTTPAKQVSPDKDDGDNWQGSQ